MGIQASIEGTIHGINELFSTHYDHNIGWGVLLVDTANACISLNHAACCCMTVFFCLDVPVSF